jgi:serine/threonine protein kinase
MSPEYATEGIFSDKSDIYSFGVIMLEIISGQKVSHIFPESDMPLVEYVSRLYLFFLCTC